MGGPQPTVCESGCLDGGWGLAHVLEETDSGWTRTEILEAIVGLLQKHAADEYEIGQTASEFRDRHECRAQREGREVAGMLERMTRFVTRDAD